MPTANISLIPTRRAFGRAGARPRLDESFASLHKATSTDANSTDEMQLNDLALPDLTIYAAAARDLDPAGATASPRRPGFSDDQVSWVARRTRVRRARIRLALRAADPETLRQALQYLRENLGVPVDWDEPYRCETYFARLLPVQAETLPVRPPGQQAAATTPPWLGLALAAAHEEIEHDIVSDYWKNFVFSAILAGAAGGGMLAFAVIMTRSLRRMTAYAEKVAAGNEADVDLPDPRSRDEIGTFGPRISSNGRADSRRHAGAA